MEIEFNTNRILKPGGGQPIASQSAAKPSEDSVRLEGVRALEEKLKQLPTVRPENVERGKALVKDVKYPPAELLDRIAYLLAIGSGER
jgi:hypothetical protein